MTMSECLGTALMADYVEFFGCGVYMSSVLSVFGMGASMIGDVDSFCAACAYLLFQFM